MHFWVVASTTLLALLFADFTNAISYRCENNQVLIVQSFGNDTIRMHCQKLNLCGHQNLKCNYDREQPSCGGRNNFVSHVNQVTPTGPVSHVCCELQHNSAQSVPNHDGNDCFVYELPDGSSKDSTQGRTRKQHSIDENDQLTVLQNVAQIPEQIDGISGYRMKLFMLRNKSPPSLIVKAIERLPDGYRVTICRPRCGNFVREGEIGRNEKTVKAPVINGGDIMHGKVQSPAEWAAASWSGWSSSSWSSWSTSKLIGETDAEAKARGQIRGDRNKIEEAPNGGEDKRWGSGLNSGRTEGSGWPTGGITNNINVHATGGSGGLGGEGGEGQGGAVSGVHGGNAGAVAIASGNGSGAAAGVVAIDGGGSGKFGIGNAGKKGNAGGNGNFGGEGNTNSGLGSGNGSEGGPDGDLGKSKAGGPNGDGTEEGDKGNGNGNGNKGKGKGNGGGNGSEEGDSDNNGNGKKPNANGNGNGNGADSSESGASGAPNGNNHGKGKGDGSSESGGASPDGDNGNGKNKGGKGGNGGKDDKATMIMEPDGGVEAINKGDEEDRTSKGSESGSGNGEGDGKGNGSGEGSNNNGDGSSPNGSGNNGLGDGDGNDPNKVKVISGPSHLSSEKPDGDGSNGVGDGNGDNNGNGGKGDGTGENGNKGNSNENDGNKGDGSNGNKNGANGGEGDGTGGSNNNGSPDGEASGQGKSGEENGRPNAEGDGTDSGDGNKAGGTGAGAGGPDGNGDNSGNKGDGSSPDGADGNGGNANGASGENAGGDGAEDGGDAGNKSDEVESSGEGSGGDVTSAEFENGPGENPARPAGGSGEGANGNGEGAGTNNGGNGNGDGDKNGAGGDGNGNKGTGTDGGANKGDAGTNNGDNNGGKITPAEEDGEGGAGGGAGGGNAGVAADPGVGGGAGGGVAAAPPAGFGGLGGGLMSCFSGDMEVTTVSGTKRMDELEIGDLVLVPASGNLLKYEKVEMFYHREPETTARFVQINTESGKTLTLTSLHLLPFDDCEALNEAHLNVEDIDTFMRQSKFAHKAVAGQCVISVTPSGILSIDRIISVNRRVSKGIYSPMTVEGSIIANGILSSCFSQLESHAVQKLAYDALVGIYNIFGYLQDAIVEPTQEIPSMLNYIHQLSRFVLPFSKY